MAATQQEKQITCGCGAALRVVSAKASRRSQWARQRVICHRCGFRGTRWVPTARHEQDGTGSRITAVLVPDQREG